MNFRAENAQERLPLLDELAEQDPTPGLVHHVLSKFGEHCHLVIILDEFDRLPDGDVPRLVADTIKSLSDSTAPATLVVVGVGDSVANLVRGHGNPSDSI